MEGKDDRSKQKRRNMKQTKRKVAVVHGGVVDVADSSDEQRFTGRNGWISAKVAPQQRPLDMMLNSGDDDDDDVGAAQLRAGDFNTMSQNISSGKHFQFASEKSWELPEDGGVQQLLADKTDASEYFILNLNLLNAGLQTIPFYKRLDYAASMFDRTQIAAMEKAAEMAEPKYQKILSEIGENPRHQLNSAGSRKSAATPAQTLKSATPAPAVIGDELDDLLGITAQVAKVALNVGGIENVAPVDAATPAAAVDGVAVTTTKKDDDIQQWLDSVLEE